MDSGFYYHVYLIKKYFEILYMEQGGVVLFSKNRACKVFGIDTVRLKMFDDCEFLLYNVRYVPKLR